MKKTAIRIAWILSMMLIFLPGATESAFGDEVDEGLPAAASDTVKERTREMIRSGIPPREAVAMTEAMVRNRFREEHVIRAQNIVMDVKKKEIPAAPIIDKVFEGVAKKATDERVVLAMEATASRYSYAYDRAKEVATDRNRIDRIASAIADGMAAGMETRDIDRIRERVRERAQTMNRSQVEELALETFQAARTMARMGVSSGIAADVVSQAHQQRFSLQEMKEVHQSFRENATRTNSGRLAEQMAHGIGRGDKAHLGTTAGGRGVRMEGATGAGSEAGHGGGGMDGSGSGAGGGGGPGGGDSGGGSGGSGPGGGDSGGGSGGSGPGGGDSGGGSGASGSGGGDSGGGSAGSGSGGGHGGSEGSGGRGGESGGGGSGGGGGRR